MNAARPPKDRLPPLGKAYEYGLLNVGRRYQDPDERGGVRVVEIVESTPGARYVTIQTVTRAGVVPKYRPQVQIDAQKLLTWKPATSGGEA